MNKDRRYRFETKFENANEIIAWCKDTFGPKHRKRWGFSNGTGLDASWLQYPPTIFINNDEDAMAFKLRWI